MKLIDYMWTHDENKNLTVKDEFGVTLAFYDGRDSIPEELNDREVAGIADDGNYNVIVWIK